MTKKDVEKAEEQASAADAEVEETEETDEQETKEETTDDFDYKAEYEKVVANKDKEDHAWEKLRKENKELKERLELEGNPDAAKLLDEKLNSFKTELQSEKVKEQISSLTDDEYAQKLIELKLEKHPTLSPKDAFALINAGRSKQQIEEMSRAKNSSERAGDGSGAGQRKQESTEPKVPADTLKIINRMNLKWDGKRYSKEGGMFALEFQNGSWQQVKLK